MTLILRLIFNQLYLMPNKLILLFALVICFTSCGSENSYPDASKIEVDTKVYRFDQDLQQLDTTQIELGLSILKEKYNSLYDLYFGKVMVLTSKENPELPSSLKGFLTDSRIQKLHDTINIVFDDFKPFEKELIKATQLLKHYIPDLKDPNFYTLISEFGIQNFIFQDGKTDGVGIGLDMFLGNEFPYKDLDPANPSFSNYLTRTYNKDHLVKKSIDPIVTDQVGNPNGKRMIDYMIHHGKRLYILDRILPEYHDTIIYEQSLEHLNWLKANELEVWSFFLEQSLIYETNQLKINKYIEPTPKSYGMPDQAPGRTALYIGKKIVEKYMSKNSDLSILNLLEEMNSQKILEASKYKPKRN